MRRRTIRSDVRARAPRKSSDGLATSRKPVVVHREDADLVDRAEAVLVRAQNAVLAVRFAFEVEHRVDQMLEQPRPGDRAVFGDVADDERRAAGALRELHERLRAVANLRDAAGVRFRFGQPDGLNRIDDERERRLRFEPIEHRAQIRFGKDEQPAASMRRACAARAVSLARPTLRRRRRRRRRCARRRAAICSSSVDFPAPGGPPTSVRLPGTMPPPSTASNSGIPTRMRARCAPSMSRSGTGRPRLDAADAVARRARGATANGRSSKEFHASHCGQRPSQRGDSKPQAEQK